MVKNVIEKLYKLIENLNDQVLCFHEFLEIIKKEEDSLKGHVFLEVEDAIKDKDQIFRTILNLEEKRQFLVRQICQMTGFQDRGETLSLKEFLIIYEKFASYKNESPEDSLLLKSLNDLKKTASEFQSFMANAQEKIAKNRTIIERMKENITSSIHFFESLGQGNESYNAKGLIKNEALSQNKATSLAMKV